MKTFTVAGLAGTFTFILMILWGIAEVRAYYEYSAGIGSYWELSEKASTLQQKSTYLDQYVIAIKQPGQFAANDATLFPTPNNSFDENLIALTSLQGRMHQIQGMDEQSFAYQTAIQQITQQEQGEAGSLTGTFEGCWYLQNHWLLWGWHDLIAWCSMAFVLVTVFVLSIG